MRIWFTKYKHYLSSQTIPLSLLLPACLWHLLQNSHGNPTCMGSQTTCLSVRRVILNLKTLPLSTSIAMERSRAYGRNSFQKAALAAFGDSNSPCSKSTIPFIALHQYSQHWGTATMPEASFSWPPKKISWNATKFSRDAGLYYSTFRQVWSCL